MTKCKLCGRELIEAPKSSWIKVPEIKKEITMIEWTKPYNEIQVPKGCELIDVRDCITVLDNEKYVKLLGIKDEWNEFACRQLNIDRKNNESRWLFRDGSAGLNAGYGGLLCSSGAGRVIFCRELK